jgi:SAM-dependent methyltransferase
VPRLLSLIPPGTRRIVDIGCGNGYLAGLLAARGFEVVGIEPSADGIAQARAAHPAVRFEQLSVDSELGPQIGEDFDLVIATEVIEHLPAPRALLRAGLQVLRPGGRMLVSTPYHGYLKNLALSIVGGWDHHFKVDWDGGHVKFFSTRTLGKMALDCGFHSVEFAYAGRAMWLWNSMIAVAVKSS